jgi:hypothetical protein
MKRRVSLSIALSAGVTAFLVGCGPSLPGLPGGLVLEEHALAQPPDSDSGTFLPVEGTQEEILARHDAERAKAFLDPVFMIAGNPAIRAPWKDGELVAVMYTLAGDPLEQHVEISSDGTVIFTAFAGLPSPALPLQAFWTYDGHWALEILLAMPDVWAGQIYVDGALLNQSRGYTDAFGLQMLSGKPFFFFTRDGQLGLSYDGQEAELEYEAISHYLCCSGSVLNPLQAENMVAFFAQRADNWYYVELGSFE